MNRKDKNGREITNGQLVVFNRHGVSTYGVISRIEACGRCHIVNEDGCHLRAASDVVGCRAIIEEAVS